MHVPVEASGEDARVWFIVQEANPGDEKAFGAGVDCANVSRGGNQRCWEEAKWMTHARETGLPSCRRNRANTPIHAIRRACSKQSMSSYCDAKGC